MLVRRNIGALFPLFLVMATMGLAQRRIIPHITSPTGGFTSKLVLSNLKSDPKTYRILGYDQTGVLVTTAEGELAPWQTLTRAADEFFGMNLSHLEIDRADDVAVSIIYQADRPGSGPAHVHESTVQSPSWRILPGNEEVTWDGLAAVNMGGAATDISVTQLDATGQTLGGPHTVFSAVPPNSKVLYLFSAHFASVAQSVFEISAAEPLALLALRGNHASDFLWENKAIPIDGFTPEPNRIIAHVTRQSGGFRSQVIVSNPFEGEETFTFRAYDQAGNLVNVVEGSVAAGHTLFQDAETFLGTDISHFEISDETGLPVSMSYQKDSEDGGPAQVHDFSQKSAGWRIYPGEPAVTWDGLAVVNQGAGPTDILAWQVDANGSLLRGPVTVVQQLSAQAKALYLFASDFPSEADAYFELTATQPIAVMALRGNQASDFLWENGAVPLPEAEADTKPPPRIDYALAFDPTRRVAIMVGGFDVNFDLLEDTWLWNGRRWRQVETEGSPLPRSHHGGTFDSHTNQMIIFGGFEGRIAKRNDFRAFDGASWQAFPGETTIPADDGELVFDSHRNVLILTVSSGNTLQTWEYQGSAWQQKFTPTDPGKRIDQGLVYDEKRQRVVMFGGFGIGNRINAETWEYDGNDWLRINPPTSPPALAGMAMFYDSVQGRVVFFGGMDAARAITGETWAYDGQQWQRVDTAQAPEPRWVAYAAFDPKRQVATLFGGEGEDENGLIMYGDTWEFDGTNWQKR